MTSIDTYLKNLDFVIANLEKESDKIILNNKENILDLNREKQLFDYGIDNSGKIITPYYSAFTVSSKRLFKLPYNRVTLFQTGSFYDGFDFRISNDKLLIFSRDSKTSDLQDRYGSGIFGLTFENQKILNYEIIKPELLNFINKYI